jgi:hypothetical protein
MDGWIYVDVVGDRFVVRMDSIQVDTNWISNQHPTLDHIYILVSLHHHLHHSPMEV